MNIIKLIMDEDDQPICSICLMPIKYGMPAWLIYDSECRHQHHTRCMLHWGKSCPICKYNNNISELITIECILHANRYYRSFIIKLQKHDNIALAYKFIQEITNIPTKKIRIKSLVMENNVFKTKQPLKLNKTFQYYYDIYNTTINKLLGHNKLNNITLHCYLSKRMTSKIHSDPNLYEFVDPDNDYLLLNYNNTESDESDSDDFVRYSCPCC